MKRNRKQNLLSMGVAGILAISLFAVVGSDLSGSLESLQANIVGSKENVALGEFIQESYEESVRVTANIAMTDIQSISFFVTYDGNEVVPMFDDIDTSASFVYTNDVLGSSTLILTQVPDISIGDQILKLPLTGDASRLVFSDINIVFKDQEKTGVSITVQ